MRYYEDNTRRYYIGRACRKCGGPIEHLMGRGRPPAFCEACRTAIDLRPRRPVGRPRKQHRHREEIVWLYANTIASMREIGKRFDMSHELVRLIINTDDPQAHVEHRHRLNELYEARAINERHNRVQRAIALDVHCIICGNWVGPDRTERKSVTFHTCSPECAELWQKYATSIKYQIDDELRERHRYRHARAILRHPERYVKAKPLTLKHAQAVVQAYMRGEPLPRNRTFRRNAKSSDEYKAALERVRRARASRHDPPASTQT